MISRRVLAAAAAAWCPDCAGWLKARHFPPIPLASKHCTHPDLVLFARFTDVLDEPEAATP